MTLYYFKGYGTLRLIPAKGWNKNTLSYFIRRLKQTRLITRKPVTKNIIERSEVFHLNFADITVVTIKDKLVPRIDSNNFSGITISWRTNLRCEEIECY